MKKLIDLIGLKFYVIQYKWGRKMYGGQWYLIHVKGLPMGNFWSKEQSFSCQAVTIKTEDY